MFTLSRLARLSISRALNSTPGSLATPLSTAASTPTANSTVPDNTASNKPAPTPPSTESRWRRLKRERRQRPVPSNRTPSFDRSKRYPLDTALQYIRSAAWAKFDESLELNFRLNIDPRLASENIRGIYQLPHGSGRDTKVAAFADGIAAPQATEAGADLVGGKELIQMLRDEKAKRIKHFTACVSTPELLPSVAESLGKVLGPRGLMPNSKDQTVGGDLSSIVRRIKNGQVRYRTDRMGNMHLMVGKLSFADDKLVDNVKAATRAIVEARPSTVKRKYILKAVICSTMGPSVELEFEPLVRDILNEQD